MMSDPKPIPDDVMATAKELAVKNGLNPITSVSRFVAIGILGERERCAAIARTYPLSDVFKSHRFKSAAANASQNIADAIISKAILNLGATNE